jgi:hypothetical protein
MPVLPSVREIKIMPAATGPVSIMGNIRIPSIFGIGCPLNSFGAIKIKAPSHDIVKVIIK